MENRLPTGYAEFLADLKERIRRARVRAALSANRELILLYWEIGRMILERLYLYSFAEAYPDKEFVQQVAAQIPWSHHCTLLDKIKDPAERVWYIQQTIEHGWSRNVLVHLSPNPCFA